MSVFRDLAVFQGEGPLIIPNRILGIYATFLDSWNGARNDIKKCHPRECGNPHLSCHPEYSEEFYSLSFLVTPVRLWLKPEIHPYLIVILSLPKDLERSKAK